MKSHSNYTYNGECRFVELHLLNHRDYFNYKIFTCR